MSELDDFASRYAEAWCCQNPDKVAAFFAERGSISINNGPAAVGRTAIAKEARAFMTTFPDMVVTWLQWTVAWFGLALQSWFLISSYMLMT